MGTRRNFIKQAAALSGLSAFGLLTESIERASAIEPVEGSSYLDAKHIVVLMQENRSFDHVFGSLRGVRGFRDPRATRLPDGFPVWAQKDSKGRRYLPFRLNLAQSSATWMGDLPHSWSDQVDARNDGKYDQWLHSKRSRRPEFADMPLTMGYYTREDLPFYYALADAFTVCDQNFCSCLTGTTPNRLHLWTGTIRQKQDSQSPANVLNSDVGYDRPASWTTFPERLQELGISWKIYQNELSLESGLEGEHDAWLSNFTDNPIEWFEQYSVRFAPKHQEYVARRLREIPKEIESKQKQLQSASSVQAGRLNEEIAALQRTQNRYKIETSEFSQTRYSQLPERSRQLHERAFTTNISDPKYRQLTEIEYADGDQRRRLSVPEGDVLHQFRSDVLEGKLPTVSWLIPPERFSDHPGSAWFGAWYLSETLDILTRNPDVWKNTVFILTYDENDGYFDHVPPFVAPDPSRLETGRVSDGIDAELEFVPLEKDRDWHSAEARNSSIGLGYRVPMVVASPWSRGGAVCSQIFDHTSVLQFMEKVLSHQTGQQVKETNINSWRRAVCGDLTSVFQAPEFAKTPLKPIDRNQFVAQIHRAKFKEIPKGYHELDGDELQKLLPEDSLRRWLPEQESGLRPACPLPYELFVEGALNAVRDKLVIRFEARKELFHDRASGSPFTAYVFTEGDSFYCRNYAVLPGGLIEDGWNLSEFQNGVYRVHIHGPNGYFWAFSGSANDPGLQAKLIPTQSSDQATDARLLLCNLSDQAELAVSVIDNSYGNAGHHRKLGPKGEEIVSIPAADSHRWFDLSLQVAGHSHFLRRFAGRIENGAWSFNDPLIGI